MTHGPKVGADRSLEAEGDNVMGTMSRGNGGRGHTLWLYNVLGLEDQVSLAGTGGCVMAEPCPLTAALSIPEQGDRSLGTLPHGVRLSLFGS